MGCVFHGWAGDVHHSARNHRQRRRHPAEDALLRLYGVAITVGGRPASLARNSRSSYRLPLRGRGQAISRPLLTLECDHLQTKQKCNVASWCNFWQWSAAFSVVPFLQLFLVS